MSDSRGTLTGGVESSATEQITRSAIVAVLRSPDARTFPHVVSTLVAGGVGAIEVTLTARHALEVIAAIRGMLPDDVMVGAGTVLTEGDAVGCVEAGAQFLVAPSLVPEVVRFGRSSSTPVYPGALTPSEFVAAQQSGVDLVKLFPAATMGVSYLQHLKGPLPDIDIMPTGGIRLEDVASWLAAGASAVGLGGPLLGDSLEGGSLEALRQRVKIAVDAVRAARGED